MSGQRSFTQEENTIEARREVEIVEDGDDRPSAVGEGAKAALTAHTYLLSLPAEEDTAVA